MDNYNLELETAVEKIKKYKAKKVLIQLPDGLKPKAMHIVDTIKQSFPKIKIDIWAGPCYGSCDIPNVDEKQYDLLIQWGHSEWK